jgi:hypothetical protein
MLFFITLSIAGVYFNSKKPWAGRVVVAFTILSFVLWYAKNGEDRLAYQINSWIESIGSLSDGASKMAMATSKAPLYQKSGEGISKTNKILLTGDVVQVAGRPLNFKGEKFSQITKANADGSIANGETYYVQPSVLNKDIKVYPNAVEPKCAVAEKKAKNGKLFYVSFITDEPVELSLVALGEMYNFSGVKAKELRRSPENAPNAGSAIDSLIEAPIGTDLYNLNQTVMTLQAPAGKMVTIATRKPSAYEKAASENWHKEQLAEQM